MRKKHLYGVLNLQKLLHRIINQAGNVGWYAPDGLSIRQRYFKTIEVTIHTTTDGKTMATNMLFTTDVVNHKKHKQAITANYIHSMDAYHMRQIIRRISRENINIFLIHDSIIFDIPHSRIIRRIVAEEFNSMYKDPHALLRSFYYTIKELNPTMDWDKGFDPDIEINKIMGKATINAKPDLFN